MLTMYWRQRRDIIAVFLLFAAIFGAAFWLYRLPLGAVGYPALVCIALGLGLLAADYGRTCRRHRRLAAVCDRITASEELLPPAETVAEADYRRIIGLLCEEIRQTAAHSDERFRDTVEYYTVWAHQIKTPIAAMRLHLQNEDSPLSRHLSADLNRVEQYVEMVMTFLRLDSDTTDYVFREHRLDDIIRQAVRKFSGEFITRRLKLDFTPTDMTVVTDEKWLCFVIEQVLSNALKYTPEGTVTVRSPRPQVLVIEDTGIGIAPEDLPRIFDKGYTGAVGRREQKASGIGLYLCRRVCTNLGVGISADSVPGEGTAIRLDFSRQPVHVTYS